jgi:hypothetical protein
MDPDAIRMLEVSQEDVGRTNVSNFVRLFAKIGERPEDAQQLRSKIILSFQSYDSDPRPNWAIPEIRAFIQALDRALPYFPYFLVGDPAVEHHLFYLLCLMPFADIDNSRSYSPVKLLSLAKRKAADVTRFCAEIKDDPERATEPILLNLPAEVVREFPDIAGKVLDAMAPALRALEGRLTTTVPEARAFVNNILSRAAMISRLDRSKYPSDASLLEELLNRVNQVTNEEVNRFQKSFQECTERIGGGKVAMSSTKLRQVIRQQRRAAYRFVEIHLLLAASQPGYLQPAYIVATAIMIEFNDPELMRRIEQKAAELGVNPQQWMPSAAPDLATARATARKS